MLSKIRSHQDKTKSIIKLLKRLNTLIEDRDIDSSIFKLQSIGFKLDFIQKNGYFITGIFKRYNSIREIHIPFYKINEDILDQLEALIDEYNLYILEEHNQIYENIQSRMTRKELIDIKSIKMNWDKVYKTKIYAQIALKITIELLYSQLNEELELVKYFQKNSQD